MTAAPATSLDVARARRLTRQLQESLTVAVGLLREAFEGEVWRVLDYPSWEAYCREELPQLAALRLTVEERREVVAALAASGASLRAISGTRLVSTSQARRDLAGVQRPPTRSLDGRVRPSTSSAPRRPRLTSRARAVLIVREAGDAGVTVHDVTRRLRLSQSSTSALLSSMAADGRLVYRAPAKRGQVGRYLLGLE